MIRVARKFGGGWVKETDTTVVTIYFLGNLLIIEKRIKCLSNKSLRKPDIGLTRQRLYQLFLICSKKSKLKRKDEHNVTLNKRYY